MDNPLDLIEAIYRCLDSVSIRGLTYALADIYMRATLGAVDKEKTIEILAQNLAGTLRTDPSTAKKIIKDALLCMPADRQMSTQLVLSSSVGDEKSPTLAHIVNRHVPIDATPRAKLEVIHGLNLPRDEAEPQRGRIVAKGGGLFSTKSAVRTIRNYYLNAPFSDVDFIRTAVSIRRKNMLNRPISPQDIYIREYRHISNHPVYIALDVSGSMKEYIGRVTKLKVAKNAIARYLYQVAHMGGYISLVLFNTEADFMWTPHNTQRFWREMVEILRYVYASGGTELSSALELLHSYKATRDVVVITDGRTGDVEKTLDLAKKFRRLHFIATERSQFLRHMAKLTGGRYGELSSTIDISSLI
ncbi:MAG: vWA domain-containing protein [Pyrobaculum sp.]